MPELPEVETVRRGLEPHVTGVLIETVTLNREDLRFPFPDGFRAARPRGRADRARRAGRAKYLLFTLSTAGHGSATWG